MDKLIIVGNFLSSIIRASTPILFAALGILIMQLSGIINMGAEGIMLIGAFCGVIGTFYTGNIWLGILIAALISGIFGLLFAAIAVKFRVNQVVLGIAFNIFASGITTTLSRGVFGLNESPPKLDSFSPIFLGFPLPVFIAFLLLPVIAFIMYKTRTGIYLRSVGEYPEAVEASGISVSKIRLISGFAGSALIGFGGAFLSLGQLNFFIEDMVNGRGYIALAAVSFGRYTPVGTMAAVLLFGGGETLQYQLQAAGSKIPYQFALMIPYILTIIALAVFIKGSSDPAALGKAYKKDR